MAHHVEPMVMDSDFDNKENSLHHSNVLPFTEKGYEELDVSELNMKLRYSVTPTPSPMSKSYTADSYDYKSLESGDDHSNITITDTKNLTRSLNSTIAKNDNVLKSLTLPLQRIQPEKGADNNNRSSILRPLESIVDNHNLNITITTPNDENISSPSSVSSTLNTPEATTPTKDGGSPIMRGLKSVLNMFRSSQSPIPPSENENVVNPLVLSPDIPALTNELKSQVIVSTPISTQKKKEMSPTKKISPVNDTSLVFNEDLEKELQWKDETTIFFSQERIPIHKLLPRHPVTITKSNPMIADSLQQGYQDQNSSVEYMDISYNDSIKDSTMTDIDVTTKNIENTLIESDGEFVDCETTLTKSQTIEDNKTPVVESQNLTVEYEKTSGCRLKQIILNTTQDILDATLSVRPEDLLPEIDTKNKSLDADNIDIPDLSIGVDYQKLDQTVDVISPVITDESANSTKTIMEQNDERLTEVTTVLNPDSQTESVDVNMLQRDANQTLKYDTQLGVTDNLNATITVETLDHENNICDEQIIPIACNLSEKDLLNEVKELNDIHIEKPLEPALMLNETVTITSAIQENNNSLPENTTNEKTLSSVPILNSSEMVSTLPIFMTENLEVNLINEVDKKPVDIPLPDEDDIEKELAIDDDTRIKIAHRQSAGIQGNMELASSNADSAYVGSGRVDGGVILINCAKIILEENEMENATDQNNSNKTMDAHVSGKENMECIEILKNSSVLMEQVNENQDVAPINITQNISSLPYVINETMTNNKTENLEDMLLAVALNTEPIKTNNEILITQQEVDMKFNSDLVAKTTEIQMEICSRSETDKPNVEICNIQKEGLVLPDTNIYEMSCRNNSTFVDHEISSQEHLKDVKESGISDLNNTTPIIENVNECPGSQQVDEEVVLSENNSPFVSVTADHIPASLEGISKHLDAVDTTKPIDEVSRSLNSPPITTKGYYFNFDDANFDPFATKTNIRMSPPIDIPNKQETVNDEIKNIEKSVPRKENRRRKSQPNKKQPMPTKKLNATFNGSTLQKVEDPAPETKIKLSSPTTLDLSLKNVTIEENYVISETNCCVLNETATVYNKILEIEPQTCKEKIEETVEAVTETSDTSNSNTNELKTTSSSEQSTCVLASTSSNDNNLHSRNVFNLPEIDDRNFNPFATKCKMHQSPPPSLHIDNSVHEGEIEKSPDNSVTLIKKNGEKNYLFEDKVDSELMEKENISNALVSSKSTDERNISTDEIHTEDEDTVEGPFLEADENDLSHKEPNFDSDNDMMQFNELPLQNNEENIDSGEMFIDAEAFEFLLNQNKSNTVVDSGKESLFLKFDPLFAKRMSVMKSDSVVAALTSLQKRESISNEQQSLSQKTSPIAGPSNAEVTQPVELNINEDFNDLNNTVSKPMMVVPPAVNSVTPRNKSLTPTRSNRRSITFTSPAMAVIDRLLSLSMNNSPAHDTTVTHVSREQNEADIALSQLRELLAEKEITVYNLKSESNELKNRLSTLESHLKTLEVEGKEKLKKINQLNETLAQKTKMNKSMASVVEEYERTIASLIAEAAQDKKKHAEERLKLTNERDEQTAHLASMEVSFNDIHSKYEKSKQVIFQCKANEDMLKKSIKDFEENLAKMQTNYELLKQHATSKLNHANNELEKINKSHEAEVLKLNAMIKRKDLHITSLEESLIQKTKANEELTAICDELINKVS